MKPRPKIGNAGFASRRKELVALMEPDSMAILPGSEIQYRNNGVEYRFRQNSDFHYLTGFDEPDAVFVLVPGRQYGEAILFCREREYDHERWYGSVTGPERAVQLYGMDDAFPIDDMDDILPGLIEGRSRIYYGMGAHPSFDSKIISWVDNIAMDNRAGTAAPGDFIQLEQYLHELRLYKSPREVEVLRYGAKISSGAHNTVMGMITPGMMEYEVEAELQYQFAIKGARHPAYPSIVGGGSNGCIFHYIDNDSALQDGDLVLIDAGGEYEYYASDVTRTLPVSGKFSEAQAKLYDIVLAAQLAAIEQVAPGNHWNQPHEAAIAVITRGLVDLGLLTGDIDELIETDAYKRFCVHRTGHWIGLDVHDVGGYKVGDEWRVFEKGMMSSIEPGIYIPEHMTDVPEEFRGIGIRIEDNVLVTKDGKEVLTESIPKTIEDIELLMQGR